MELAKAQKIAERVVDLLAPSCSRLVHDIDLVCIPSNQGQLFYALQTLGKVKMAGPKIIRVAMGFSRGIDLDLYVATPETWATLLFIRTGSTSHNIRLCMRAKNLGMKLHADGRGLERCLAGQGPAIDNATSAIIRCDTEESIFAALELPYKQPEEREV
jgi:DNA polymerase/3'-5' exonuclease PolX